MGWCEIGIKGSAHRADKAIHVLYLYYARTSFNTTDRLHSKTFSYLREV